MLAKIAVRNCFLPKFWKVEKIYTYKLGPIGDRSGKGWLGFSGISNFWPSIVTGLRPEDFVESHILQAACDTPIERVTG